ncbi:MAG TPA: VOC family protein [Dehalococcoidia bacterium]|nr:VOC family protein [Dehalococcoidia bacterium]
MELAKPHIDAGLFTNNTAAMLDFWQHEVGLAFEEVLPMGGGVRQHRHAMNGSVLKLNSVRDPMAEQPPCGYRELLIADNRVAAPRALVDPDGNRVMLVPRGHDGVTGILVRLAVRDEEAFHRFYGEALELERAGERRYRCGDSLLEFGADAAAAETGRMQARGYRYLTVQVRDVDAEHAGIVARGGAEGRAPITLGTTARISFVRDPDGNWIEISQRASLTGPLPG